MAASRSALRVRSRLRSRRVRTAQLGDDICRSLPLRMQICTRCRTALSAGMVVGMRQQTVLISGGGIAGSTLAYWLARHGFRPTVVERAQGVRSSGNPVDVRGSATQVAE